MNTRKLRSAFARMLMSLACPAALARPRAAPALLCALLLGGGTALADSPADYRHQWPLTLAGDGPWYRLDLPMAAHFAATHGDLRDLRLFNAAGEPLAHALVPAARQAETREQRRDVPLFPLYGTDEDGARPPALRVTRRDDGTLIELSAEQTRPGAASASQRRGWLLDASALDVPLLRLSLDWGPDAPEGFQRFSMEASDDLRQWQPWGEGHVVRLSGGADTLDQREVQLPGKRARYLRLTWVSPREAPALRSGTLYGQDRQRQPAPLAWSDPMPAHAAPGGRLEWRLPLALPLARFQIELAAGHRLAPVTLEARRHDQDPWFRLADGLLYRVPRDGAEARQDELALPGIAVRELRLSADARGGGLGDGEHRARVAVRATQLVFLARGEPPYTLALGRRDASSAALPLATLMPGTSAPRLDTLGSATARPVAIPTGSEPPAGAGGMSWQRWGLWAVLLLGVGLLALMAASLLRRPPER